MWFIIYATYALAFWYGVGLILESRHEVDPVYTPAVLMIVSIPVLIPIITFTPYLSVYILLADRPGFVQENII